MQRNPLHYPVTAALAALLLSGCASTAPSPAPAPTESAPKAAAQEKDPNSAYASTYKPLPSGPVLITNATILTAAGDRIERGSILLQDGRVAAIGGGGNVQAPAGATVVDAAGKWVTPGIIDAHSHLGVYAAPGVEANEDGNEMSEPVTADVWAEHAVWPQDPQFPLALAGGVTAMQILPGSGNLIGGRGVTIKNVPARHVDQMKFPGAPFGLKMACGENPKRFYGEKGRSPMTRMGNVAGYRRAWIEAAEYRRQWDEHRDRQSRKKKSESSDAFGGDRTPVRDLEKETLAGVLAGEILVQNHCYRADEMLTMIDVSREFGFKIAAFHHAVEAYKIADVLVWSGNPFSVYSRAEKVYVDGALIFDRGRLQPRTDFEVGIIPNGLEGGVQ
jgi:imidazolonepropionase-like amidohydrolase